MTTAANSTFAAVRVVRLGPGIGWIESISTVAIAASRAGDAGCRAVGSRATSGDIVCVGGELVQHVRAVLLVRAGIAKLQCHEPGSLVERARARVRLKCVDPHRSGQRR